MKKPQPDFASYLSLLHHAQLVANQRGVGTIDLPDLLIALTHDPGLAGQALRELGLTTDAVTAASRSATTSLLASVGVTTQPYLPVASSEKYDMTQRARRLLRSTPTPESLLTLLLAETSGTIQEILKIAGCSTQQVSTTLAQLQADTPPATKSSTTEPLGAQPSELSAPKHLTSQQSQHINQPLADIWDFVTAAENLPRWAPSLEAIAPTPDPHSWQGVATAPEPRHRFGSKVRTDPGERQLTIEQAVNETNHSVTYTLSHAPHLNLNTQVIEVQLTSDRSGTNVTVTSGWLRPPHTLTPAALKPLRPLLGLVLKPLQRLVTTIQALTIGRELAKALTSGERS